MRTSITMLALMLGCAACAGDTPKESHIDSGRVCAGELYDPCIDEHSCPGSVCQNFPSEFQVCTKSCTPGMNDSCGVTHDGRAATCDATTMLCKPPAANDCQL